MGHGHLAGPQSISALMKRERPVCWSMLDTSCIGKLMPTVLKKWTKAGAHCDQRRDTHSLHNVDGARRTPRLSFPASSDIFLTKFPCFAPMPTVSSRIAIAQP